MMENTSESRFLPCNTMKWCSGKIDGNETINLVETMTRLSKETVWYTCIPRGNESRLSEWKRCTATSCGCSIFSCSSSSANPSRSLENKRFAVSKPPSMCKIAPSSRVYATLVTRHVARNYGIVFIAY